MPATTQSDLLQVTRSEFAKLDALVDTISTEIALAKDDDDTSMKDVVAHRAHWIDLFLGWHADGQAGRPVHFPAEGYKWNELKRYNAALRVRQADMGWPEAIAMLRTRAATLIDFIASRSDTDLYAGPMKGANNAWTTGRWAEAAGASHFRSATKYIRAALRRHGVPPDGKTAPTRA